MISFGRNREVNIVKKASGHIMHANVTASPPPGEVGDCTGWERLSLDEYKGHRPPDCVLLSLGSTSCFMLKPACQKEEIKAPAGGSGADCLKFSLS